MAIIKPSLKFEGSELNLTSSNAPYIKDSVRRAVFNKTTNNEGAYLYFLPGYKADSNGAGVWYKKIFIRDNFGTSYKEKYHVSSANDPAAYFSNNFRMLFPDEAGPRKEMVNGKEFKKYPNFGRVTERVLYNVAFAQKLAAGCHVLDLPLRNGADILMNYLETKELSGNVRPPVNDPERCLPVFVKLKEASSNPWSLAVDTSQPVQLPVELADSDYLYNLDDILAVKTDEEIIIKLREMYAGQVFDACMDGYGGLTKGAVAGHNFPAATLSATPQAEPVAIAAPAPPLPDNPIPIAVPVAAINIPKANIAGPAKPAEVPPAVDLDSLPANPISAGKMTREQALKFINEN